MIQLTAYSVMDCWDAHVVCSEVTGSGRTWTQLGHDLVAMSDAPGASVEQLRTLSRWLARVADEWDRRG